MKMINSAIVTRTLTNKTTNAAVDLYEVKGNVAYEPVVEPRDIVDKFTGEIRHTQVCNVKFLIDEPDNTVEQMQVAFWGNKATEAAARYGVGDFIAVTNCVINKRSYTDKKGNARVTYDCSEPKGLNAKQKSEFGMRVAMLRKKADTFVECKTEAPVVEDKAEPAKVTARAEKKVEAKAQPKPIIIPESEDIPF